MKRVELDMRRPPAPRDYDEFVRKAEGAEAPKPPVALVPEPSGHQAPASLGAQDPKALGALEPEPLAVQAPAPLVALAPKPSSVQAPEDQGDEGTRASNAQALESLGSQAPKPPTKRRGKIAPKQTIDRKDGRTLRRIGIYFPVEVAKELLVRCAQEDVELSDYVVEAVRRSLR